MENTELNLGSVAVDELRSDFIQDAFRRLGPRENLLDLGCGTRPFRPVYEAYVGFSVGMDAPYTLHDRGTIDVHALGAALPFKDGAFDIVLCTEVLEHVREPSVVLSEIHRVLKKGGALVMTTPLLVPLHEEPHDYFRYTSHGLKYLCAKSDFEVVCLEPFCGLTGVMLSFLVQAQLKVWYSVRKVLRMSWLYSRLNPFILFFVYLPQRFYIAVLRHLLKVRALRRVHEKLTYTTKGYGLVAIKQ